MTATTISMTSGNGQRRVIVGVDTHKEAHVAVALDELGGLLGTGSFNADRAGYRALIAWAVAFGGAVIFGVEGTGSYGAGLASAIRRSGIGVLEVLRTDRRDRRLRGSLRPPTTLPSPESRNPYESGREPRTVQNEWSFYDRRPVNRDRVDRSTRLDPSSTSPIQLARHCSCLDRVPDGLDP